MNKKLLLALRSLLIALSIFAAPLKSSATHFFGMDLRYDYVNATTYTIQLICYGDCSGASFPTFPSSTPYVFLYNGNTYQSCYTLALQAPTNGVEITPVCPAQANQTWCINPNNPIPGIKKFVYQATATVPTTSNVWRFIWQGNMVSSSAGRSNAITNITGGSTAALIDTLNNVNGGNTSPTLTSLPTPFFCLNYHYFYNPGAVDPDGDSLMIWLVPGKNGNDAGCGGQSATLGTVTYMAGYTSDHPLHCAVGSFAYDSTDGQIAWTPDITQRSIVDYNIQEYRNIGGTRTLVGTSQREMTFLVISCQNNPPSAHIDSMSAGGVVVDSADMKVCSSAGSFTFQLAPTAPLGDSIYITWSGLPTAGAFPATMTVVGNGGLTPVATFLWTTLNVPIGTYTFYVTYRSTTCPLNSVQTLAYRVTILPNPSSQVSIVVPSSCYDKGVISIAPAGSGSPYNISVLLGGNPIQIFSGITNTIYDTLAGSSAPGITYTIRVFNQSNCYHDTTITLINPALVAPGIVSVNPSFCGGSDGSITLTGLQPGIPDTIAWKFNGIYQPAIVLTVSPTGSVILPNLPAGDYDSITTHYLYCTTPAVYDTLKNPGFVVGNMNFSNPSHCGVCDGSITIGGLEPGQTDTVHYRFNTVQQAPYIFNVPPSGIITMNGLCAGFYDSIIIHTAAVCYSGALGPIQISNPAVVITAPLITQPSACGLCDGSMIISGLEPGQYDTIRYQIGGIWQPYGIFAVGQDGNINLLNLCQGQYDSIFVSIGIPLGGCVSNIQNGVLTPTNIAANFTDVIHYSCKGPDTVYFTNTSANGAVHARWHFGDGAMDTTMNPVHVYDTQGVYNVTLYASNLPCIDSITMAVDTRHPINADYSISADTLCQGGTVIFTNNSTGGNPQYWWHFGDGSVVDSLDLNPPGHVYLNSGVFNTYLVERDSLGCYDSAKATIYVDPIGGAFITASDTAICAGQQIQFHANYTSTGSRGISWDLGDGYTVANQNPVTHAYTGTNLSQSIDVVLTVTNRICPDTTATKTIHVMPYPSINLGNDTAMCPGASSFTIADHINQGNPLASWVWNTGETASGITVTQPGTYYSTVTIEGCSNSDTLVVNDDCYMRVPNVFTPNGDGINDYFFPRQWLSSGVTSFQMEIYNRWGQKIFESTNTEGLGWDGKMNNVMQPEGVYIYIIDVTFKDGKHEHHQGNVTLMK